MPNIIKKGTPAIYIGSFKHLKGLGGYADEDVDESEGFIWMLFDGKRRHRIQLTCLQWMPAGTQFDNRTEKAKPVETIVEID